jgi:hypothetical protein
MPEKSGYENLYEQIMNAIFIKINYAILLRVTTITHKAKISGAQLYLRISPNLLLPMTVAAVVYFSARINPRGTVISAIIIATGDVTID